MRSWIRFGWARRTAAFRSSLRLKLLLPVIGGAVLLIAIIGFIFISTYNDFDWRNRTEVAQKVDAVRNGFLDKLQQADNIAQLIAKMPDLGDAIDARDQGVVAQIVEPFTRFTDLNFLTVYNRDLEVVARGDAPAKFGSADELRPWLVALVGQPSDQVHAAAALPYEGRLLLLGAEPIRTVNERFGGVAVAGFVIDDRFLAGIKQRTGADIIVAYDGKPIVATVDSRRLHAMGTFRPVEFDASTEGAGRLALSVALDEVPQRAAFWRRLVTVIAILAMTSIVVVGGALVLTLRLVGSIQALRAVMFNPDTSPQSKFFMRSIEAAAPSHGVQAIAAPVRATTEIEAALQDFSRQPNGGLILPTDTFTRMRSKMIAELAERHRLPSISAYDGFAKDGGLMYYGAIVNLPDQFRQAASYVDRILKGEKPSDLPVQRAVKYTLVLNLRTAKALGLTVSLPLTGLADEVIE